MLKDPLVIPKIDDTKASSEVKILDKFLELLNTDEKKACYGFRHVSHANDLNAIESLLVTDDLFRCAARRHSLEEQPPLV